MALRTGAVAGAVPVTPPQARTALFYNKAVRQLNYLGLKATTAPLSPLPLSFPYTFFYKKLPKTAKAEIFIPTSSKIEGTATSSRPRGSYTWGM